MAGTGTQTSTLPTGTLNGSRLGHESRSSHGQENSTISKHNYRAGGTRQTIGGSSRAPLSNVIPNRKGFSEHNSQSRRIQGRTNGNTSKSESDPDLYRQDGGSEGADIYGLDNDIPENMYKPEDVNPEGWIHRDKLVKIENEELQAAGMQLAQARRSQVKPTKRDSAQSNRNETAAVDQSAQAGREAGKSRVSELVVQEEDGGTNWDLRTPEEIVADQATQIEQAEQAEQTASQAYTNPVLRKTRSKIPVLASSPISTTSPVLPLPKEAEPEISMPRKRTLSDTMSPEVQPTSKARNREGSVNSPVHSPTPKDDTNLIKTPTPEEVVPTGLKTPTPSKLTPKVTATSPPGSAMTKKTTPRLRQTSITAKQNQPASPSPKPTPKSTDVDRPRTAMNRPEGDPPWLATMYKPDPMLPPDQQIIPTHARRQQQAQWEEEGAIPTTYDRNFSPLAVHTAPETPKPSTPVARQDAPSSEKPGETSPWPLKPIISTRSSNTGRPGTGNSSTGGYSTMPRVTSPVINPSPRMGTIGTPRVDGQSVQVPVRMQVQRPPEDEKDDGTVKKGCACCIVM